MFNPPHFIISNYKIKYHLTVVYRFTPQIGSAGIVRDFMRQWIKRVAKNLTTIIFQVNIYKLTKILILIIIESF